MALIYCTDARIRADANEHDEHVTSESYAVLKAASVILRKMNRARPADFNKLLDLFSGDLGTAGITRKAEAAQRRATSLPGCGPV